MEIISFLIDFILHIDQHLAILLSQYGTWFYAILFVILFCETGLVFMPFLPGDSLLFMTGALAAIPENNINIHLIALLLIFAAISGDAVNYTVGRFFGEKLFRNPHSRLFKQSHLEKTQLFYAKHGGKTIILARFIPIIRTFAPFVAGIGHMKYRHFAIYNVTGGVIWVVLFAYAGYFFGTLQFVQKNLEYLLIAIIFISILPPFIEVLRSKIKMRTSRAQGL